MTIPRAGATVFEFGQRGFDSCGKFSSAASLEIGRLEITQQEFRVDVSAAAYHAVATQGNSHLRFNNRGLAAVDYKVDISTLSKFRL